MEDMLAMVCMHEDGIHVDDIASKFGISCHMVYTNLYRYWDAKSWLLRTLWVDKYTKHLKRARRKRYALQHQ